jgi:hypothetical protein
MSGPLTLRADERPHSTPFSPSGFTRAEACTKSVELTSSKAVAGRPRRTVSRDAVFGTVTHEVLAWCLRTGYPPAKVGAVAVGDETVQVSDSMRSMVQVALDEVARRLPGRKLLIEARVNLPWLRLWGYVDVATAEPPVSVLDLKTGFHPVSPASDQIGLYLLPLQLGLTRSIEGEGAAVGVIVQPKADQPVSEHVWTFAELRSLRDRVLALGERLRRHDYTYKAGEWCRWCGVAAECPMLGAVARDAALADLSVPTLVADGSFGAAALDEALEMGPALEHRTRQARLLAKQYLIGGGKLRTHKLVKNKRGNLDIVSRDDPREEVDVVGTLEGFLRSNTAAQFKMAAAAVTPVPRG